MLSSYVQNDKIISGLDSQFLVSWSNAELRE